jgi:proline-specific peptidase
VNAETLCAISFLGGITLVEETGYLPFHEYKTWYKIVKPHEKTYNKIPLLLLAGGPGLSVDTLSSIFSIGTDRPVIGYDQLGSGRSTRSNELKLLRIDDFVKQFHAFLDKMDISKVHLLGHSWGAMLGSIIAVRYPERIKSLILYSGIADWNICLQKREQVKMSLPEHIKKVMERYERENNFSAPEYIKAREDFDRNHCCKVSWPDAVQAAINDMDFETNYMMWGRKDSELPRFNITGSLNKIVCPTLIIEGKYDGYSTGQAELFFAGIPNSEVVRFDNSAHYAHIEEPENFNNRISHFLRRVEEEGYGA